jgi:hypothetical protein
MSRFRSYLQQVLEDVPQHTQAQALLQCRPDYLHNMPQQQHHKGCVKALNLLSARDLNRAQKTLGALCSCILCLVCQTNSNMMVLLVPQSQHPTSPICILSGLVYALETAATRENT